MSSACRVSSNGNLRFHRNVECLNLLLSSGADLNKRDIMGRWVPPLLLSTLQTSKTCDFNEFLLSPCVLAAGPRCTMRLLMGGTSALWPWLALALRSMSLTRQAVLPCTTLLPLKPLAGLKHLCSQTNKPQTYNEFWKILKFTSMLNVLSESRFFLWLHIVSNKSNGTLNWQQTSLI